MTTANSDTAASHQGASASGTVASAGGTAANASAAATAQTSGTSASSAAAAAAASGAQLIVRPPLDVYKKLTVVRRPDEEVVYQNADGSWGKVTNLDETRMIANKNKKVEVGGDDDAKMSGEADDPKSAAEDADEVSLADAIWKVPNQLAGQYLT